MILHGSFRPDIPLVTDIKLRGIVHINMTDNESSYQWSQVFFELQRRYVGAVRNFFQNSKKAEGYRILNQFRNAVVNLDLDSKLRLLDILHFSQIVFVL